MKLASLKIASVAAAVAMLAACTETGSIGSSLVQIDSDVVIGTDFELTGKSIVNDEVQSRTILQMVGSIDAKEYGRLSSDFVTQFLPVAQIDTILKSKEQIDSIKLLMMYTRGSFVGDSVVPMGLEVYRLNKQLPAPIFSNFDPKDYYSESDFLGSSIYGASQLSAATDSIAKLSYREIYVDMPKDLAYELFDLYQTDPASFLSPTAFAKHFPGIYVKNSYGSGRVTKIGATLLQFYYHQDTKNSADRDTTYYYTGNFFQATPEIITNNNIDYSMSPRINERVADGEALIVSPAGYDVEIRFPVKEIIEYYNANKGKLSVINGLTMSIPAEKVANTYGINPPSQLLMVKKGLKKQFFENSEVTNGKTSFYADFNSSTASYNFSALRSYLLDAIEHYDELTEDDFTFVLTPVYVDIETQSSYYSGSSSYVKTITPYIEQPAMTRLRLDNAKITFTFSNQGSK